ncbi:type IV secretion protein Rhs [Aggregatibacter actinomycetemcomitans]|uniref:Type IV secretion protein Rhs n=2 Tax=Aggregatibacter actinomycetemcomitans TaxID=714 RepID=A0A5D0ELP3_AGGAC|nr:type IV secretion protein Rhs [Aggregatibacter actinomycetemcomitans D7S-1]AMQ94186.1 type IV secretion protein Rhs [Aggregatibacter actinomycetemcomitans]KND82574.1 type IV secretion protein Rhs [Aggregatibacter actinomycetemcomitans serotype a str. H5P1]KOE31682.1 type IV secretion protein Rhs [Aggregatibacter actinomycetemcomitans D17P-3]PHO20512.1 type IV secretion protein Rhs [Aggregatibacter actinomycetemcomitans]
MGRDQTNKINRNLMTKIEKDEVLNIGNHLSLDVYANQDAKTGRDYTHQVNRNALVKVGTQLKQHSKAVKMAGSSLAANGVKPSCEIF